MSVILSALLFYCVQSEIWYDPNASKCPTHTYTVPLCPLSCQHWGSCMSDREPEHGLPEKGEKEAFTGFISYRLEIDCTFLLYHYIYSVGFKVALVH